MNLITIAQAKAFRESIGATHVVIFAVSEDGAQHVATHGLAPKHAREAAKVGNKLKAALGWPDGLCHDKPVERICKNCAFWKADYGMHCFNGWTGDGTEGHCHLEPRREHTLHRNTCQHFQPE